MSRYSTWPTLTTGLAEHPAVRAWRQFAPGGAMPLALTPLKPQLEPYHKSGVYRLHKAAADGGDVVAKRCSNDTARTEQVIYQQILPHLGVSALQCHGFLGEPDGAHTWLFLEDAGDQPYTKDRSNRLAAWLAQMHSSATAVAAGKPLPECGLNHYRSHLHAAIQLISSAIQTRALAPQDRQMLQKVLQLCRHLESAWQQVEHLCGHVPDTLVHGDLVPKNLRITLRNGTLCLLVLDWETAGWGPPLPDLAPWSPSLYASPAGDLDAYLAAVKPYWPHLQPDTMGLCADTGALLRLVSSVYWAACGIAYEWNAKLMDQFHLYELRLRGLMQVLRCR